ncbi:hypothetical protein Hte_000489 [Hypoxylon texense]
MKSFRQKLEKLRLDKKGSEDSESGAHGTSRSDKSPGYQAQTPPTSSIEASVEQVQGHQNVATSLEHANLTSTSTAEVLTGATKQEPPVTPLSPGHTRGLRILRSPAQATLDIIFIHGLIGDSLRTWQHQPSGVYWPTDLLPKEFPKARILTFGYDADVTKLFGAVGQGTLRNHATTLVCEYAAIRQRDAFEQRGSDYSQSGNGDTRRRDVILVVHSLGGLVTKKALCISSESAIDGEKALDLDTIGICFLGTPHRGSDMAELASIATKCLKLTGKRVNSRLLDLLRPNSEVLGDIQAGFGYWLRRNNKRTYVASFFEEHEMPRIGMVVSQTSALIEGYPQLPIPSNHRDMTKFSDIEDTGIVRVIGQMRTMILQKRVNEQPSDDAPQLIPGYQDCLIELSYPDMNRRYESILPPADDTCEWLERHPIYNQWLASGDGIMWILGHPGTGKSTLMKHAAQQSAQARRIHRNDYFTLNFFFYNLGSELQKSVEGMLRAVLFQILQAFPSVTGNPVISKVLNQAFAGNKSMSMSKKSAWESANLMEILKESIALVLKHTDVWLFIDALDECRGVGEDTSVDTEEIRQLIGSFRRILRKSASDPHRLYICCSCRHYPHIASLNDGYKVLVENENARDIKEYITQELASEILPNHRDLLESLVETISSKAMGSFQWVRLVTQKTIGMYTAGKNVSKIQACVDDLPKHLSDLYGSILSSIPEDDRSRSRKLFEWACLSSEPLKLPGLRLMMNIDPQKHPGSFKDLENLPEFIEDDFQMERIVQSLSGGLAELNEGDTESSDSYTSSWTDTDRSTDHSYASEETDGGSDANLISDVLQSIDFSWVKEPETKRLFLIHQSVKDYMMTEGFQILNGFLIPNNALLARAYHDMTVSIASFITMQHTKNQQYALSGYSQAASQYSDRAIIDWSVCERPPKFRRTWSKAIKCIEMSPVTCDISLLLQHISLAYFETFDDRPTLAIIQSSLLWYKSALEHGFGDTFFGDISNYASSAKKRGVGEIEAHVISCIPNPVMQDPFLRRKVMDLACCGEFTEILYHAFTFTNRADNCVRQFYLAMAAEAGSCNALMLLLDDNKMPFKEPLEDQEALVKASENGHTDVVKLLLANSANIHQTNDHMETALHRAADKGKDEICRILLDRGAEIDARDEDGATPFMAAVRRGHQAVCDILIGHSPDIDASDNDGITVLTHAVRGGNTHIMSALMCGTQNWPKTVLVTESTMRQSGLEALREDNVEFCELAIRCKGIDLLSSVGINAASAAKFEALSCLEFFLDHRQDVNLTTHNGAIPLFWAIYTGSVEVIDILLDRDDIDVNHIWKNGPRSNTALCYLASRPQWEPGMAIARKLLNHQSVDPNLKPCAATPLHLAIFYHRRCGYDPSKFPTHEEPSKFIQLLLDHPRIDINIEDAKGNSPLALAAWYGHSGIVGQILEQKLIQSGHKYPFGITPLHLAILGRIPTGEAVVSWGPRAKVVDILLERTDIDINSIDGFGQTPLDLAMRLNEAEVAYSSNDGSDSNILDTGDDKSNTGVDINLQEKIEACRSIIRRLRAHGAMCGDCIRSGNMAHETITSISTPATEPMDRAKTTETPKTSKPAKGWRGIRANLGHPGSKELGNVRS